jgi:hypothetical protein
LEQWQSSLTDINDIVKTARENIVNNNTNWCWRRGRGREWSFLNFLSFFFKYKLNGYIKLYNKDFLYRQRES